MNHLMSIATVIALVGAVGCLFLVRQKDFVPATGSGEREEARRYRRWTTTGDRTRSASAHAG